LRVGDLSAKYAPTLGTAPRFLNAYTNFANGNGWVASQGTTATTLTAQATAGATTMSVASGTGLLNGVVLITNQGTAQQQQYKITAGGGTTTLTVSPAIVTTLANGSTVTPLWGNAAHLNDPAGWTAFAYWLANYPALFSNPGSKPIVWLGNSWAVPALTEFAAAIHAAYPSATVTMAGVSGNTSAQLLARFGTDVATNAAYVIINEPGINDTLTSVSIASQQANLEALIAKIRAIGAVPVVLGGMPLQGAPSQSAGQNTAQVNAFASPTQFPAAPLSAVDARLAAAVTTPSGATAYGVGAVALDTGGTSNTGIGHQTLANNTSGTANTAVGEWALLSSSTGSGNTAVGQGALAFSTTGANNTAVGYLTLENTSTGISNAALGQGALAANTTGNSNTAVGFGALSVTTNSNNTALGYQALGGGNANLNNTAVGFQSLYNDTGYSNTAVGVQAGYGNTSGFESVFIGEYAGYAPNGVAANATTTGAHQVCIGMGTGQASTTQVNEVVAVGHNAVVGGNGAVAIGGGASASAAGAIAIGQDSAGTAASSSTADLAVIGTSLTTLKVGKLSISNATVGTTAPSAGAAAALPATPAQYVTVTINGTSRQIAVY
jgi:hypothetical protein